MILEIIIYSNNNYNLDIYCDGFLALTMSDIGVYDYSKYMARYLKKYA